jgi:SOS response regulatory protein OraA/RecX
VEAVIACLKGSGLLDDGRYIKAWLRDRISRGDVPLKMRLRLRQKGLPRELVDACLETMLDNETERQLLEKRLALLKRKGATGAGPSGVNDLFRTLRYEGFSREALDAEESLA